MTLPPPVRLPLFAVTAIVLLTLIVPVLPLEDPTRMNMAARLAPPVWPNLLGRDEFGRDVLSRILWGARTSLSVSVAASVMAAFAGTILGLVGGYFRGIVELLTVRASEVVLCLPPLLLALLVVALLGPGTGTLILCLSVLFAPAYARVAFAGTLSVGALDYVMAQRALGVHPLRIIPRTVLPNILPPLIVQFSLTLAAAMVLESGLSFLGLGVVPPRPSWGLMIQGARGTMAQAPLLLVWPCLALSAVVITLNTLCDRLRDVLDPRAAVASRLPAFDPPRTASAPEDKPALLRVSGLTLAIGEVSLIRDISFTVAPGETLGLVGESGSGKTLTALALMGLLPPGIAVTGGRVDFTGRDGVTAELLSMNEARLRQLRGNEIGMIFQDPSGSLDPVQRIGAQVAEAIAVHRSIGRREGEAQTLRLLEEVGLPDPARVARAFPHELSGGQKQRAMIAGAIANEPVLLIADEPTTALDVTIQAQILDLLEARKCRSGRMGMIFITHNLAVVARIADRVCVMYAGELVEEGPVSIVFNAPKHPYTAALLASVPEVDTPRLLAIEGTVPQPHQFPPGCRFAPRCGLMTRDCQAAVPPLKSVGEGHRSRCLHSDAVA